MTPITVLYGGYAIVGCGLPIAVGLALADKLQKHSEIVTACFFGDGAVAEGEFFESLNLAASALKTAAHSGASIPPRYRSPQIANPATQG